MADLTPNDYLAKEFSKNGVCADITIEEWLGGWLSIVGGANGKPTAQQFNKIFNVLSSLVKANASNIETVTKTANDALPANSFNAAEINKLLADFGKTLTGLDADTVDGKHAKDFATAEQGKTADSALPAVSFTGAAILRLLLGVDGSGSKLDADLLDGNEASHFAQDVNSIHAYAYSFSNNVHSFSGTGTNGKAYISQSYASGHQFSVNGITVKAYTGGDPVTFLPGGHWYFFTYDKDANGTYSINFTAACTSNYLLLSGGKMTGVLYFANGTAYYVDQNGKARLASIESLGNISAAGDLSTQGKLTVNGNITGARVYNAVYNDYAEFFPRGEATEPGDIIALSTETSEETYGKAVTGRRIIGIHSEEYGHIVGGIVPPEGKDFEEYNMERFIPVGLVGRCHCKVDGPVNRGDIIVSSGIPGVGTVNNSPASPLDIVGFAVEDKSSGGTGLVRVKIGR